MNRRDFLAASSATLAAGALTSRLQSAEPVVTATDSRYQPGPLPTLPVVKPGEFVFAAAHLDHSHIDGMCRSLTEAGGTLKWVFDPDAKKVAAFARRYPSIRVATSLQQILDDAEVKLVAAAAVTSERGPLGCRVMEAGKDYFTDKAPLTTLPQLEQARAVSARTGRKFMVYYSERLTNESAMFATDLVKQGAIGRVLQVLNLAPHRLNAPSRPDWFWKRDKFGGILCDIGSHQFEQFIAYTGLNDASVLHAGVANYAHPEYPEFEDFGEANLLADTGATQYIRVDWFTPAAVTAFGDGRTFILGTKGFIELRKYLDLARERTASHLYLADDKALQHIPVAGKVGYAFFGQLILDCLNRTELAMTQAHAFKAAELGVKAQLAARRLG
ncbi:MAG: Gfo/Idh/MocA family oxidoreductase [Opitutaceae bacterium]|nr:Gfo/Idh/MocA family oxidoreductase [Opitutaceae bacterium]